MQEKILNIIRKICPDDFYEIGFSDLKGLLDFKFIGFNYGITIIRKLDDEIIDNIKKGPTLEYYNHYNLINSELNENTKRISKELLKLNIKTFTVKSTVSENEINKDFDKTLKYVFSHKMAATRSGLGWIGKTDLFISKRFGARVRLATLLIDMPVKSDYTPVKKSLCGQCDICVKSCPANAANGMLWNINVDRNDFYNPFKCRNYCREISKKKLNKEISLCGICMSACPKSKKG